MKIIRLLIFLLPLICACSSHQSVNKDIAPDKYNVLMVVLDACRADHLGCYGYKLPTSPNIDKLASESIVFEQVYSQGIQTLPSFGRFQPSYQRNRHPR